MKTFTNVMKALSDPSRAKIIKMLKVKTLCACELQQALDLSQPLVSKHLKILENAELVTREKDGLWVNYSLADGNQSPYAASLLGNLSHWLQEEPRITDLIEQVPHLSR